MQKRNMKKKELTKNLKKMEASINQKKNAKNSQEGEDQDSKPVDSRKKEKQGKKYVISMVPAVEKAKK